MSIYLLVTFQCETIMFDFDRTLTYKHFIHGIKNIFGVTESSHKFRLFNDLALHLSPTLFNEIMGNIEINELNVIVKLQDERVAYEHFEMDLIFKTKFDGICCGTPVKNNNDIRRQTKSEKYVRL